MSLALHVAQSVRRQCSDFDLWKDEELLLRSLQTLGSFSIRRSGDALDGICSVYELLTCTGLQALDFLRRVLESRDSHDGYVTEIFFLEALLTTR